MDLETSKALSSCRSCKYNYSHMLKRIDNLERQLKLSTSHLENSSHDATEQEQPMETSPAGPVLQEGLESDQVNAVNAA